MTSTRKRSTGRAAGKAAPPPLPPTWDERLIDRMRPYKAEIAGLGLFALAILTFLALVGLTGSALLEPWVRLLRQGFGWGTPLVVLLAAAAGLALVARRLDHPLRARARHIVGLEMVLLCILALVHLVAGRGLVGATSGRGGGLVGWALSEPVRELIGPVLTVLLLIALGALGVGLVAGVTWAGAAQWLRMVTVQLREWADELDEELAGRRPAGSAPAAAAAAPPILRIDASEVLAPTDGAARQQRRDRRLPPLSLLEEGTTASVSDEELLDKRRIIEGTLLDFGLPARVTEVRRGPAVTQFGVLPGFIERPGPDGDPKQFKVRVGQIASLQRDLALALEVPRLRIEAPIPGRGLVGVEVPNDETSVVRLRPILQSDAFTRIKSPLAVALGRDVSGAPICTDLGALPHFLIAGTTGSGKSVCLNSFITCLAVNNFPDRLRMVMLDPKRVELIRFNGLPHLLGNVEVEPARAVGVLRWLTAEMDRRYQLFAAIGAKNLKEYNRKGPKAAARLPGPFEPLPAIAVFVDELADLMSSYPAETERTLCRLAQMARATGIHLVVATQRPSTDVITGLIKANFPARGSFAVASGTDSRVVLDTVGAEQLLGKGDMLFLPPDAGAPMRIQGCFISDREIESIVAYWQEAMPEPQVATTPWESLILRESFVGDRDEMLEQAIALAQKHDALTTSLIQRRLRVGYPRAARLMETLYEMGLVEDPKEGGRTRRTFTNEGEDPLDDFLARRNQGD
jgi:S-DNA-T family DNA segregation ATPase FtsK/SpoIIIE